MTQEQELEFWKDIAGATFQQLKQFQPEVTFMPSDNGKEVYIKSSLPVVIRINNKNRININFIAGFNVTLLIEY